MPTDTTTTLDHAPTDAAIHRTDLPLDRDAPPGDRRRLSELAPDRPVVAQPTSPGHPERQGPPGPSQPASPNTVPPADGSDPDRPVPPLDPGVEDDRDRPADAPDTLPDTGEDEREEHRNTPPPPGYDEKAEDRGHDGATASSAARPPARGDQADDDGTRIRQLDPLPEGEGPRLIALMNQKGGVGKTTTAANVAAALAEGGLNVLAIDLDPQAHLTLSLGVEPDGIEVSMYDLLIDADVSAIETVQEVGRP